MFKIMLALHLIAAVAIIGPLIQATTTAVRGIRRRDAALTAASSRTIKIYSIASVAVVIFGFGVMSATSPYTHKPAASFGETWIWLSLLLWVIAVAVAYLIVARGMDTATQRLSAGQEVDSSTRGQAAGAGGVVGLILIVIIVLMVFQPGGH